ncbi:hypothetical protein FA15DRAFT_419231 [Coprinopsis marcescibilis]|uniref:Uncharacterized protein n=1 Tax=Coprinopsis marcescibilis TaxID=230819 RepID=A0A5C3L7T9_COPMA|nr:hypothetical protein FA15DRAFT_419231 [Coprinopsis marcescibilis]
MSSIDLNDVNIMLSNTTHPTSTLATARNRARTQGTSHRRRYSKAHISRPSVNETIDEESNASSSEADHSDPCTSATKKLTGVESSPMVIYLVDEDTQSFVQEDISMWDDERGILALRKYYTLKDEATTTVMESQRAWEDTPFSVFAVQTFDPPRQPDAMQALLEHSVRNYVLLPTSLHQIQERLVNLRCTLKLLYSSPLTAHPFLNSTLKLKHPPLPFLYINNVALIRPLKALHLDAIRPISHFAFKLPSSSKGMKKTSRELCRMALCILECLVPFVAALWMDKAQHQLQTI